MLQPEFYLMARHEARFHVQLEICSVTPPDRTPGPMLVEARVVRVFRGEDGLAVDDRLHLVEEVSRPGDEIPCGGIIWKSHDAMLGARYLEAFLNGDPPNCSVPLCQSQIIPRPTTRPVMAGWHPLAAARIRALRAAAMRDAEGYRWWQFWK